MGKKVYKKRFGDAKDGRLIRGKELDTNHYVMPIIWPNRTDCEGFISETIDLTAVDAYIKEKRKGEWGNKISLFSFIVAALGKLVTNRPKMNRFYRNKRLYERYDVSLGFIVKKSLSDDGEEALARILIDPDDTLESVLDKVQKEVEFCRSDSIDKTSDDLRILMKFPHFIGKMVLGVMKFIDRHWTIPQSISESDIFFKSVAISNLGSVRMNAAYHHLSNWGTNSFFVVIGEKKLRPFYNRDGSFEMRDSIEIGLTIDERIADGFYFSKTINLFRNYMQHPEMLERPFYEEKECESEENAD